MCGIAGIVRNDPKFPLNSDLLVRMLSSIRHRGPDESGFFIDHHAAIGNVRLSIIDLATGQQPMCNYNSSLWIVFNGEIFNYIELREELIRLGHTFRTTSDTEVLLHVFEQFGADGLKKLNGQFAFAIWNILSQELFIARDRVGIRPLYYTITGGSLIFGSEIKAILEHPKVQPEFDLQALSQLYTFWTPLPGKSVFKNIRELEPGCFMIFKNGDLKIQRYWDISFAQPDNYITHSLPEAIEGFQEVLTDSVRIRLRSDVPVAAYLSGGLDSSIITSLVKKVSPGNLNTFSIGFADADYDETNFQKEVSEYLTTRHTGFKCTSKDIAEIFPEVVWYCESPIFRTAPAPMYLLSKMVRQNNIKVVLTGEGADEIMGGYDIFKEAQIRQFWAKEPTSKYRPLLLKRLYPYVPQIASMNAQMLRFVFGYKLSEVESPFYAFLLRWNNGAFIRKYYSKEIQNQVNGYNPVDDVTSILPDGFDKLDILSKSQWIETKLLMSNYLLSSQGDRMGMGNSIEGRYPFLDYRVIEYASKLPSDFKLHGLNEKFLMKKMMTGKLPESVVKRNKQAYRAPITSVFMPDKPIEYVNSLLSKETLTKYSLFDSELVGQLINRLQTGKNISENDSMALTAVLSTQMIYAMYIEKSFKPIDYSELIKPRIIDKR